MSLPVARMFVAVAVPTTTAMFWLFAPDADQPGGSRTVGTVLAVLAGAAFGSLAAFLRWQSLPAGEPVADERVVDLDALRGDPPGLGLLDPSPLPRHRAQRGAHR